MRTGDNSPDPNVSIAAKAADCCGRNYKSRPAIELAYNFHGLAASRIACQPRTFIKSPGLSGSIAEYYYRNRLLLVFTDDIRKGKLHANHNVILQKSVCR